MRNQSIAGAILALASDGTVWEWLSGATELSGIGGQSAEVLESGAVLAGVLQVTVRIPTEVAPGLAVPIVLMAGEARCQDGVTVAVR